MAAKKKRASTPKKPPPVPKQAKPVLLGVPAAEIARLFVVDRSTVSRDWVNAGCPQEKDQSFLLEKVIPWRIALEEKRTEERIGEEKAARIGVLKVKKRLEQFKLGVLRRKYIPAETIEQRLMTLSTEIRVNLDNLPHAWAQRVRPENPVEGQKIVEEMVESIRSRLEKIEEDS